MALTWDFFYALITTNLARFSLCSGFNVVGYGLFASFFCLSQEYFDDKRSPEYLFNQSCNFHICSNRHCQSLAVASVFWFSSFNEFFSVENPCLVMPCRNVIIVPHSIWWVESFFMEKDLGVLSRVVVVLFCQWVLWCQFNQVSSTCRLFFWSSAIFIQPLEPSQNPRSSQLF